MEKGIHYRHRFFLKSISRYCAHLKSCLHLQMLWLCPLCANPDQQSSSRAHHGQAISKCLTPSACMDRARCRSFSLTIDDWNDTISPAWYGQLHAAAYHIADTSQRCQTPPSSSGPGRSPLKAQTGVRVPLGASISQKPPTLMLSGFVYVKV